MQEQIEQCLPDILWNASSSRTQNRHRSRQCKCAAAYGTETITLKNGSEAEVSRPFRSYPRENTGSALLSGNVYCVHCGGRIFVYLENHLLGEWFSRYTKKTAA